MFEPFWTTSESGMGLGLFLARELLKQFNGEIEFFHHKKDGVFGFHISVVGIQD
jgi:C4-dicarboxylate-specific signal transduction histidine kinase